MNDLSDKEERELNPPPRVYRVSFNTKLWFLGFSLFGFALYGYVLVDRRMSEHRFYAHQEIKPITLRPSAMPALSVTDPQTGELQNLAFGDGRFVLLNIWATWCPPCQKEMPSLAQFSKRFDGRLRVIALSVDDDVKAVRDFMAEHAPNFTVLWDQDKKSVMHLGVEKYPETFLISPDGELMTQFSGPRDWNAPTTIDYFLNVLR